MEAKEILQGDQWLGHPAHPAFVALPIGSWIFSLLMDGLAAVTRNECVQEAADKAITIGLVGAGVSAATGIAEFTRTPPGSVAQRDALVHGALNASGAAVYGINAAIRSARNAKGRPTGFLPKFLSLAGVATVAYTGWLGGTLAYSHGIGVKLEKAMEEQESAGQQSSQQQKPAQQPRQQQSHEARASV